MKKRLLVGSLVAGAVAGLMFWRRKGGSGYEDDAIDSASAGGEFGDRPADAPEQKAAPAETLTDADPAALSMASRIATSAGAIRNEWPALSEDEINSTDGNVDALAGVISDKSGQPKEQVRARLDAIIAEETGRASFPAH